jgi:hypothetical protein
VLLYTSLPVVAVVYTGCIERDVIEIRNSSPDRIQVTVDYYKHGCLPPITGDSGASETEWTLLRRVRLDPGQHQEVTVPSSGIFECIDWRLRAYDRQGQIVWAGQGFDEDLAPRDSISEHWLLVIDTEKLNAYAAGPPRAVLTLVVKIINDNGETARIATFDFVSQAGKPVWQEEQSGPETVYTSQSFTLEAGAYRFSQKWLPTYSTDLTCRGKGYNEPFIYRTIGDWEGGVRLAPGASVTCEIVNDDRSAVTPSP